MFTRYSASFGTAIVLTFGLLFLMQLLIATGRSSITEVDPGSIVPTILKVQEDTEVIPDEDPPPPPEVEVQPPTVIERVFTDGPVIATRVVPPGKIDNPDVFAGVPDGNAVLLVAAQPQYPIRMLQRGIEGYVIVQFDVTTEGSVANASVLQSSHRGFESAALQAAERMKFKPKVVSGEPQVVHGVQKQFTFEIED